MNAESRPSAPQPAPEQDPIDRLVDRKARIDDLRIARRPTYERLERESSVIERVYGELAGASGFLLKEIEARLVGEASALLGPTFKTQSYKPLDLFKDIDIEPITAEAPKTSRESDTLTNMKRTVEGMVRATKKLGLVEPGQVRKEKEKKSRGLKDARPVEFILPSGRQMRGKEGKMVKSLKGAENRTLDRDQLAQRLQPGVKLETARVRVNTTARRARQSLRGSSLDIKITRDYEKKTTNYSLVDKQKGKKKR